MARGHYVTLDMSTPSSPADSRAFPSTRTCVCLSKRPAGWPLSTVIASSRAKSVMAHRHAQADQVAFRNRRCPVADAYGDLVAAGEVKADPDQQRAADAIDKFAAGLVRGEGLLKRLFGKANGPGGIYLWGGVGRGKSMLMDLAYGSISIEPKRRTHFAPFMLEVHARLLDARKSEEGDPVIAVAEEFAQEVKLLAFDEMMVTNPADAMIMSRLFTAMMKEGVAIITTSNRPPRDLYKDGLNRELFLPFIELIESRMAVLPLNGPTITASTGCRTRYLARTHGPRQDEAKRGVLPADRLSVEDRAHVPSEIWMSAAAERSTSRMLKGVAVFSFKRRAARPVGPPTIWQSRGAFIRHHRRHSDHDPRDAHEASRFVT